MQTPGTRTQRPHPHPRAGAWMKTEAIFPAVKSGAALRFPRALHTCHPTGTELCKAMLAGCAGQTQGRCRASLPGWRAGLPCHRSGSRLGWHVTGGSSCWHTGQGTAGLLGCWRSPECPGRRQLPGWGWWRERIRPSSPPTNPSPASSHPVFADGDFPLWWVFSFAKPWFI